MPSTALLIRTSPRQCLRVQHLLLELLHLGNACCGACRYACCCCACSRRGAALLLQCTLSLHSLLLQCELPLQCCRLSPLYLLLSAPLLRFLRIE
jgi:hypothetical protein